MKIFIFIFIFSFSFSLPSTVFSQDAIIAVGQAEQDKDKLVIDDAELVNLSGDEKRLSGELIEIIRNDFLFYKHKFNTVDYSDKGKNSYSIPNEQKWESDGINFFISSKMEKNRNGGVSANFKIWSKATKTLPLPEVFSFNAVNLRLTAHKVADSIYKAIVGKSSIFNSKIIFISDRTTEREIEKELYIMDFDGRRVDKLTNFNSVVLSPSISSDNSKVMFSVITSKKDTSANKVRILKNIDLKLMDLKTRSLTTISDRPGINSGAIFSHHPDLIYLTLSFSGNADIYEMNIKTRALRKITTHYGEDVDPSLTQEGALMTFLSNRSGRAHIYTTDPRGTEKEVKRISFVGQFNATPRFSPDGKEIVFTSWVDQGFDLYRIGSDGNNLVRLTKELGSNEDPVFSPDGEFIVFSSKTKSKTGQTQNLYMMNREGEVLGQLTQNFGHCFSPRWSN